MKGRQITLSITMLALVVLLAGAGCGDTRTEKTFSAETPTVAANNDNAQFKLEVMPKEENLNTNINLAESKMEWHGEKITGSGHDGTIKISGGDASVLEGKLTGSVDIDMTSIFTEDGEAVMNHLKGEDFFNVEKYPKSTFTFKDMVKNPRNTDSTHTITGDLTIKDKTHEIAFPAVIEETDAELVGEAKIAIDRTKWDVIYGSGNFFKELGDKAIKDEITFNLLLKVKK